jgi:hypothetical protein
LLFVAHRLIESMGGTIWARPREDGEAAKFGFQLQLLHEDVWQWASRSSASSLFATCPRSRA